MIVVCGPVNNVYYGITSPLTDLLDGCSRCQFSPRSVPAIPALQQNMRLVFVDNLRYLSVVRTRFQGTEYSASQVIGVVLFTPLSSRANRDHEESRRG